MKQSTTPRSVEQPSPLDLWSGIRLRVREAIELVMEEELAVALGAARYERGLRRSGYRNGSQTRRVLTEHGPTLLRIPRGRLAAAPNTPPVVETTSPPQRGPRGFDLRDSAQRMRRRGIKSNLSGRMERLSKIFI